jgi:hypothetical protein
LSSIFFFTFAATTTCTFTVVGHAASQASVRLRDVVIYGIILFKYHGSSTIFLACELNGYDASCDITGLILLCSSQNRAFMPLDEVMLR